VSPLGFICPLTKKLFAEEIRRNKKLIMKKYPSTVILRSTLVGLFIVTCIYNSFGRIDKNKNPEKATYISLAGKVLSEGNKVEADGNIHKFNSSVLHLFRTKSRSSKGTILFFPGGGYEMLKVKDEGEPFVSFLNVDSFDVVILEYPIAPGGQTRNQALTDAIKAFRLLKANCNTFGLHGNRINIMGVSSGGHLAARTVQKLGNKEQPDDLILISPSYLDETSTGTVYPAIMPPVQPTARLFVTFSVNDNRPWITSGQEYSKIWKGYDGQAIFNLLSDSVYNSNPLQSTLKLAGILKSFLNSKPEKVAAISNPAANPVAGYNFKRHAAKLELVVKERFDLIMMGNSITNNFEKQEYQPVWNQFFAPRNAINLGYSGYRTENLLWNIQNGELEGQSPKVLVLEIGTNNVDEKHYPTRHTAGQLAGGIEAIVKLLREKLPDTKIILLRCFPGCYGGPNPTSHRAILERASDMVSKLADGKHIFYCDVNHVFLNMDGSINKDMMRDWLHPSPAGAKAWAQAMEPLLSELMGDKSLDTEIPVNTAIIPAPKLENDSYDWWVRHADVLHVKDSIDPEIVLIGNSITHFWGGEPKLKYADGKPRIPNGPKAWDSLFHNYRVLNLGFGWDRTQNVLWRLDHGELDGLHPRTVIINIGTNNTSQTQNARMNTAPEIVEGIRAICMRVRSKVPGARIVLMAVFPREESLANPRRILINEINKQLEVFARENKIDFVDIGPKMLTSGGTLPREIAGDFCHPTEKGYQIWADAIRPYIAQP
jgi:lysophospholipase L1-like esterase